MHGGTIFAKASGTGRAAIAILRLSGSDAAGILTAIAGALPRPRQATLRRFRHPRSGDVVDRGLVIWFPAPGSYTGEDLAELQIHGGGAVVAAMADALVAAGARPAEPGEFTRRAVLNGRLDLLAAEGIADLIDAETEAQRRQALRQSEGALSALVDGWSERLLSLVARQEAFIEFETEDLPPELEIETVDAVAALHDEIAARVAHSMRTERLRAGLEIAILGAPNAGKSTLLNALAERDVAIVSAIPGTTRDVVEARLSIAGVPVVLADTAGLRRTGDAIEREGVARAEARAASADLRLLVFAADAPPDAATLRYLDARALVVVNKADLGIPARSPAFDGVAVCAVSAATGFGLGALRCRLAERIEACAGDSVAAAFTRPRHIAACRDAVAPLASFAAVSWPEIRAELLREAMAALSRLTGAVSTDDILDEIFAGFCIGK